MPNRYTEVRRNRRAVELERGLKSLRTTERFDDPARVRTQPRVTELANCVAGRDAVEGQAPSSST
jgi:hypothetical protein